MDSPAREFTPGERAAALAICYQFLLFKRAQKQVLASPDNEPTALDVKIIQTPREKRQKKGQHDGAN